MTEDLTPSWEEIRLIMDEITIPADQPLTPVDRRRVYVTSWITGAALKLAEDRRQNSAVLELRG